MFKFNKLTSIFKDAKLQEAFEVDGFVIVDFYTDEELAEVRSLYKRLHENKGPGFFPSTYSADKNYRETIDLELKRIGQRRFNELLEDYQVINGCYIVKQPGEDSYLHIHQDMTLVDEREFVGINIWTTTIDLTDSNGVLYALPGSHRFYPTYRGHTIPGFYDPIQEEIKDYMVPFYLKAGQALIFDQSIIHFSPPNLSDEIRIVTNVFITQKNARFLTCYHEKDNPEFINKVELFEQELGFMTKSEQFGKDIYGRPTMGKSLGLVDYNFPCLTIEQLENQFGKKRLRNHTPTKKTVAPINVDADAIIDSKKSFWEVYTPINILREIKYRLTGN